MRHALVPMTNHARPTLLTLAKQGDKAAKGLNNIPPRPKCIMETTSLLLCSMTQNCHSFREEDMVKQMNLLVT